MFKNLFQNGCSLVIVPSTILSFTHGVLNSQAIVGGRTFCLIAETYAASCVKKRRKKRTDKKGREGRKRRKKHIPYESLVVTRHSSFAHHSTPLFPFFQNFTLFLFLSPSNCLSFSLVFVRVP